LCTRIGPAKCGWHRLLADDIPRQADIQELTRRPGANHDTLLPRRSVRFSSCTVIAKWVHIRDHDRIRFKDLSVITSSMRSSKAHRNPVPKLLPERRVPMTRTGCIHCCSASSRDSAPISIHVIVGEFGPRTLLFGQPCPDAAATNLEQVREAKHQCRRGEPLADHRVPERMWRSPPRRYCGQ